MTAAAIPWLVAGGVLFLGGGILLFRILALFDPHDPKGLR